MSLPKDELQKKLIEKAKDNPLISPLCHQIGIARATYYRWIDEDPKFKKEMEKSQKLGRSALCDLAESKIIQLTKSGNDNTALNAAKYILNHNSPIYKQVSEPSQKKDFTEKIQKLEEEKALLQEKVQNIKIVIVNGEGQPFNTEDSNSEKEKPSIGLQESQKP